jgi:uncharacterized membrane protein YgcG
MATQTRGRPVNQQELAVGVLQARCKQILLNRAAGWASPTSSSVSHVSEGTPSGTPLVVPADVAGYILIRGYARRIIAELYAGGTTSNTWRLSFRRTWTRGRISRRGSRRLGGASSASCGQSARTRATLLAGNIFPPGICAPNTPGLCLGRGNAYA